MIGRLWAVLTGRAEGGVRLLALRGSAMSVLNLGFGQGMRFVSNLILTRLLFPEAFGLMALVTVIMTGVGLAATIGLNASVIQSKRGDDPAFLDTVWTVQVLRGLFLWAAATALAAPAAAFYGEPMLAQLLPVCAVALAIDGFRPTRYLVAKRHVRLGRVSLISYVVTVANLTITALLAWWTGSVWALAAGIVTGSAINVTLLWMLLPGHRDRFRIERRALGEVVKLGKWLFLSSIATYILGQSDRAVLGAAIEIDMLGFYSIAFALATLPTRLQKGLSNQVLFPVYRMRHPADSPKNRANVFKARRMVAAGALALNAVLALIGPWLITTLYDPRYELAGPIVTLLAAGSVPILIAFGPMNAVLIRGDSMRFTISNVAMAVVQLAVMIWAVRIYGIPGAALALAAAPLLTYPLNARFLARYGNWDWRGDLALLALGATLTGAACWLHRDAMAPLFP